MQSCLYEGLIRHRRFVPKLREFRYRVYMTYLDLAELESVFVGRWLWSTRRPAVARFRRDDHFGDPAIPLDEAARQLVYDRSGRWVSGPVRLITNLASFGYCFNPISLYLCFDEHDLRVEAVVAEVTNTPWGERHCYVLDRSSAESSTTLNFKFPKELHVSPFMPPDIEYRLRLRGPGQRLVVHLEAARGPDKLLDATLTLGRRPIRGSTLARLLICHPLLPQQIMARIHWQALKLWWAGHRVFPHQPYEHRHRELTNT